jgi:hypothetical protein
MNIQQHNVTLGTAGHIDHGKTALVKLLTGCETDRLKEEKERGMSIELGFAPCVIADIEVGIVDPRPRNSSRRWWPDTGSTGASSSWRPTTASCRRPASTWTSSRCWASSTGSWP